MNIKNIPIKNIYYMMCYAYQNLKIEDYDGFTNEEFDNLTEFYTEILILSYEKIIKQGPFKEYIPFQEDSNVIKGKINVRNSMNINTVINKKISIEFEVLSENNLLNQIIKSTFLNLIYSNKIKMVQRKSIKNMLLYLTEVESIQLSSTIFNNVTYSNQNSNYRLPIDISYYLFLSLLISENGTDKQFKNIHDEQTLSSLFENFVFNFYYKLSKSEENLQVLRPQIKWKTDDNYFDALPIMQTDIVLKNLNQTLIIDTKFYQHNMKAHPLTPNNYKQISSNLYQIFAYLKNYVTNKNETLYGMLLYAKTSDIHQPAHTYKIDNENIIVNTINLDQDFEYIKKSLIELTSIANIKFSKSI